MKKALTFLAVAGLMLSLGAVLYAADAEHGKEVFKEQKCSMCHNIGGQGGKLSSLDGVGSKLKADEITKWVKTPKEMKPDTKMKAYPTLPDKDLDDLVAYLLTLKK